MIKECTHNYIIIINQIKSIAVVHADDMKIVTPCYIAKALAFLWVLSGIVKTEHTDFDRPEVTDVKYIASHDRMQKGIPSWSVIVCGSCGVCL